MLLARSQITPNVQVFTANGTWTKPDGAVWTVVEVQAGGGGTGGCPVTDGTHVALVPGGGGGEYARGVLAASSLSATVAVTVGAGGAAGTSGTGAGGTGGTSSFGAVITAIGGSGSGAPATTVSSAGSGNGGGNGGTGGTGGDLHVQGGDGGNATIISGFPVKSNNGGNSVLGCIRRATGTFSSQSTGFTGYTYGGGASGAFNPISSSAQVGNVGGAGVVIVTTYFMS
jgi:hypothetical protein